MVEKRSDQNKMFVSYDMFNEIATRLVSKIKTKNKAYIGVYGIPRGGLPLAVHLAHHLDIPFLSDPKKGCLIVDDISDSGKTLQAFTQKYDVDIVTMYYKKESVVEPDYYDSIIDSDSWIVFPWEVK